MSNSHRHPRHRTDHEQKERTEEDHEAPERNWRWNWRRKANKRAFNGMEIAAGRRSILGRLRILRRPSCDRKRRHERDRHRLHEHDRRRRRRTNSTSKGRHQSPDKSRRGWSDVSNHSWLHRYPPSISRPTKPTSSRSRARSPTFVESDEDLCDIRADIHNIQQTGSDHIDTLSDLDDDHHRLSGDIRSDPSDSGDSYDSDVSEASSCLYTNHKKDIDIVIPSNPDDGRDINVNKPLSGPEPHSNKDLAVDTPSGSDEELTASPRNTPPHSQELPTIALKFGTADDADNHHDGLPADASSGPSGSGGGYGSNLGKTLSGLEIDHNEDLDDDTLSDSDEDATTDSDENYAEGQVDTPLSSHETSDRHDDGGSDSESCTSHSSEDQEENGCHATASLSQVMKTDLADAFPKSGEIKPAPLSSGPLHPSEDHQVEDTPNAAIRLQHIADTDSSNTSSGPEGTTSASEDTSSDSEGTSSGSEDTPSDVEDISSDSEGTSSDTEDTSSNSEDTSSVSEDISSESEDTPPDFEEEHLATGDSDGSTDTSFENEEEVDDSFGQDEDYTHIPPQPSPEKREKASTIVLVSPVGPAGLDPAGLDPTGPIDPTSPIDPAGLDPAGLDPAGPVDPVVPSPPQGNVAGSEDSKPEVSPSHSASETESPSPPQPSPPLVPSIYLCPGSIVRRISEDDHHPYVIIRIEQDENGKTVFWACLCTSRPQLKKLRRQYGKRQHRKRQHRKRQHRKRQHRKRQHGKPKRWKRFIYLGGKEVNPKGFETDGLPMPTKPEVEIQGLPMPLFTFLELDEYGPFEPEDFEPFSDDSDDSDDQRHLTLSSLDKVLNQCKRHGSKKRPIQGHKRQLTYMVAKKSPPGSVPVAQPEILMKESSRKNLRSVPQ